MKNTIIFAILAVALTTALAAPHQDQDNSVTAPTIPPVTAQLLRAYLQLKSRSAVKSSPHNGNLKELNQAVARLVENGLEAIGNMGYPTATAINKAALNSKALVGLDSLEDLISVIVDVILIVFPNADIDDLIAAIPKTIHDIIASVLLYGKDLAELAEGRPEVEIIQNALGSAKKQVDKQIVKFLLLAPFVKGEKLQTLIEKTLASLISIVEDALVTVQEPVSSLLKYLNANNTWIVFTFLLRLSSSFNHILVALGLLIIDPDY